MTNAERNRLIGYFESAKKGQSKEVTGELQYIEEMAEAIRLMKRSQETRRRRIESLFRKRNYIVRH